MFFAFSNFAAFVYPVFFFVAIFLAIFLFWRACRHEFFTSQEAYDFLMVGVFGGLVGARIFDFLQRGSTDGFSLVRLIFFNRYGGFNFWGALIGIYLGLFLFLRSKKTKIWVVLDLLSAPIVFAQFFIHLGSYLEDIALGNESFLSLYYFLSYLLLFVVLKRLSAQKRHVGFFFSFYLVFSSLISLISTFFKPETFFVFNMPYEIITPAAFLTVGLANWYFLAKRNLSDDVKNFLGFVLLFIFRTKRMVLSVNEAGNFSRSIIFSPYFLVKLIGQGFLVIGREIKLGFYELLYVFGLRKFFK